MKKVADAQYTALGWGVDDITKTVIDLVSKGIVFETYPYFEQDENGIWDSKHGAKIAWFKDPDGNTLSLTEVDRTINP